MEKRGGERADVKILGAVLAISLLDGFPVLESIFATRTELQLP
jgi:hypothetical protein